MTKARDVADLLANGTVDTNELADGLITTAKLADNSVTTAKIPDAAITAAKLDVQGSDIPYDNTTSGISANTLQEAIDYLNVLSGGGSAGAQATYTRDNFTATAGQTVFTTSNGYTLGYVQVFMNGVLLAPSDFTANDESTVVLAVGASAGDEISVVAYDSFAISEVLRVLSISASANTDAIEVKADSALKVNTPASMALEVNSANPSNYIGFSKNNTAWAWIGDGSAGSDKFTIATYTNEPIALFTGGAERLLVDSSGYVTKPATPCFHLTGLTSDLYASTGEGPITSWRVVNRNVSGSWANGTFTAPVGGTYIMHFDPMYQHRGGDVTMQIWVNSNQVAYNNPHTKDSGGYNPPWHNAPVTWIGRLEYGDTVQFHWSSGGDASTFIYSGGLYTRAWGYLLG